ncbi:FAD/FMN-dependent dehydrogenase [Desulfosporosinus orientis DSM 765]|uniref:FAD/FMN-dependent dehydrogenase n=1 Tax=Desulfosporosinus orientis (strain ATCC 19365 / DSM 765 / NCIMB 8382 / VKM B-1628 / Singapore I) TaxID=768706 RepID=G7WCZ9_DESOD|nr:FAD-binding oxidoreductase [Desulfosporosinus orientis]AET67194.1 FAD/FMN-dependent dehydrogenase [Desulfosporosinus orientis DSM 765]
MRRWNGWGDDTVDFEVPQAASKYLAKLIGPAAPPNIISLEEMMAMVPASRLPMHPLLNTDPEERIRHCFGQSMSDWIYFRGGLVPIFPDGVAFPESDKDVREILGFAKEIAARVIPYGGGTSVVGHLTVPKGEQSVITVDMRRMNKLLELDKQGCLATFQAGVRGPDLEAALRAEGFTLGHYPQSFELSTLGGWVVTRSAGHFSMGYGRIERLFVGGEMETPVGTVKIPAFPASAAGPDLRELIMGSEGRLGIVTKCTVKVTALPEAEIFSAAFFPGREESVTAARALAQAGIPLSMIRLSLPEETSTTLSLKDGWQMDLLYRWLAWHGIKEQRTMLLYGAAGTRKKVNWALRRVKEIIKKHHGVYVGTSVGKHWYKSRFKLPYIRNNLWDLGYAVDTLETAVPWNQVPVTRKAIEEGLRNALIGVNEKVHVFTHLSHVYPHGTSLYITYIFRLADSPSETMLRWQTLKKAASEAIVRTGATITHQHGVGIDHQPYLAAEKGALGMEMISSLCHTLDPEGMMNPGKLVK